MYNYIKFNGLFLVFILFIIAQESFAHPQAWTPKSSFYLTGGYSLTHELYRPQQITVTNIHPVFTYNIQKTYPNNLSGMRFGFGAKFGSSASHYGYELDFNQVLAKTKITPGLKVTRPENIIVGFVDYAVNPSSQLQWILAAGSAITTIPLTTKTIPPNEVSISSSTTTSVDPAIAGVVLYHLTPMFAIKGVFIYKIGPYDSSIRGTLVPLVMINYYP